MNSASLRALKKLRLYFAVAPVRIYFRFWLVVCTYTTSLTALSTDTPSLILPLGSYLQQVPAYFTYVDPRKRQLFVKQKSWIKASVPLTCALDGFDITFNSNEETLACDKSVNIGSRNAADFLYSSLLPSGTYLDTCSGIFRTREMINGVQRSFLYATCSDRSDRSDWPLLSPDIKSNRLEITDCAVHSIKNDNGVLSCGSTPGEIRQIVFGSYLEQGCIAQYSHYSGSDDSIQTRCRVSAYKRQNFSLKRVSQCIASGGDIVFENQSLKCDTSGSVAAEVHTASSFIPPGNYSLTCARISYYPCAGSNRQGLLTASCMRLGASYEEPNSMVNARFDNNANQRCNAADMGYISNIDGVLTCDPDIVFNDEDPTQGSTAFF